MRIYRQFSTEWFCPNGTLTLDGGEVNTMKRNDCDADVSGAERIHYRVYKAGTAPPTF
ncbi:MAG: hypothetical protein H6554_03910 [Chitinophagales bacterium]|nr:hypothetical protein [Chitinophagales bacterium]